jgi:hypothetical protein
MEVWYNQHAVSKVNSYRYPGRVTGGEKKVQSRVTGNFRMVNKVPILNEEPSTYIFDTNGIQYGVDLSSTQIHIDNLVDGENVDDIEISGGLNYQIQGFIPEFTEEIYGLRAVWQLGLVRRSRTNESFEVLVPSTYTQVDFADAGDERIIHNSDDFENKYSKNKVVYNITEERIIMDVSGDNYETRRYFKKENGRLVETIGDIKLGIDELFVAYIPVAIEGYDEEHYANYGWRAPLENLILEPYYLGSTGIIIGDDARILILGQLVPMNGTINQGTVLSLNAIRNLYSEDNLDTIGFDNVAIESIFAVLISKSVESVEVVERRVSPFINPPGMKYTMGYQMDDGDDFVLYGNGQLYDNDRQERWAYNAIPDYFKVYRKKDNSIVPETQNDILEYREAVKLKDFRVTDDND